MFNSFIIFLFLFDQSIITVSSLKMNRLLSNSIQKDIQSKKFIPMLRPEPETKLSEKLSESIKYEQIYENYQPVIITASIISIRKNPDDKPKSYV